jgi:predicted NACHT family NTPase
MASVVTLSASISLADEFADFEIREELEQQLEKRLTQADLDARPALKTFEPIADSDQLSLIHASGHQTIRLVAPAGSGKTQTLVHRVLQQVKTGTRPERVLCLTFDNAAGKRMRASLVQPIVIEIVAGANGSIGTGRAARATPDGYTLSWAFGTHTFS